MQTIHDPAYVQLIATLRTKRLELGLTQEDVGKRLGKSRTFVVRVEQRERRLDILETARLLKVYGMQLRDVAGMLGKEERP